MPMALQKHSIEQRLGCILSTFLLVFTTLVTSQKESNFTFTSFAPGSVTLVADSRIINGKIRMVNISADAYSWQGTSVGRALYPQSLQFRDKKSNTTASFRTSFQFAIDTNASHFADPQTSGLAWGLFPDDTTIGDIGRRLGLMNDTNDNYLSNHIFAIEVDTGYSDFGSYQDVSSCHLGMNLLTMNSKPVFDMATPPGSKVSQCIVEDRGVQTLNVDYNGITHRLLVNLIDIAGASIANLNTTVDLYPYLLDNMFVGFSSAALYFKPHKITISSWTFSSSFGSASAPPPAPAPAVAPPPLDAPIALPPSAQSPAPYAAAPGPSGELAPGPCVGNCSSPIASKSTTSNVVVYGAAAGGAGALLLLLGLMIGCLCVKRGSKANRGFDQEAIPGGVAVVGPRRFTYKELSKATKNFSKSELLGQGGSGCVYRGILPDSGAMVAVKVIEAERSREMAEKEFQAEVSIINQIRHRNLVQLQGWCNEKGMLCLVYEYLPNGSLDSLLRKEMEAPNTVLPWGTRFNILTGVAAALAYLHEEIGQCILHRDLKPGNVLLDANYNACLADFGLARLIDHDKIAPTTMLAGTMGYMAPELPHTGRATTQTDVYAFGILIVEIICGRRPTDVDRETQVPISHPNLYYSGNAPYSASEAVFGCFKLVQ